MNQEDPQKRRAHFSDELWADFVRGIAGGGVRDEMQAHLDSGCQACRAAADWIGHVAAMAARDRSAEVPEELVRSAREIYTAARSKPAWIETLDAIRVELVSRVPLDWQPAGVRSAAAGAETSGERLLFRAGDYSVDLKLEPPSANEAAEVIGQIANERDPQENLDGVVVQMVALGRTLGETATNRFGEFLIEYPAGKKAILRVALKHKGQRIDLPLKPL